MIRQTSLRVGARTLLTGVAALGLMAGSASAESFTETDSVQTYTVPQRVTQLQLTAIGGAGGSSLSGATGGEGGVVSSTLTVTPGQTLYVYVGGDGQGVESGTSSGGAQAGGYNGGGSSAYSLGAGGGGASDVQTAPGPMSSPLLVAGGGGGTGNADYGYMNGGNAGEPQGQGGAPNSDNPSIYDAADGGQGGSQTAGGAGGVTDNGASANGQDGSAGQGGDAAAASSYGYSGGGGGGGYFGGGGGSNINAGGGGSDYVIPGSTDTSYGLSTAQPSVTITPMEGLVQLGGGTGQFGSADAGARTTLDGQTVTLTNTGNKDVNVGSVSLGGTNGNQFTLENDGCSNKSVAANDSCSVSVAFTPASDSTGSQTATLSIPSDALNASGGVTALSLSGTATAPPSTTPPTTAPTIPAPTPAPPVTPTAPTKPVGIKVTDHPAKLSLAELFRRGESVTITSHSGGTVKVQLFVYQRALTRGRHHLERAHAVRYSPKVFVSRTKEVNFGQTGGTAKVHLTIEKRYRKTLEHARGIILGIRVTGARNRRLQLPAMDRQ